MYSQFFYYTQKEEEKRRAIMRIPRKSGEQIEVDGAGDPAQLIDPDTGEIAAAWILVGVLTYSQYAFVRVRKPKNYRRKNVIGNPSLNKRYNRIFRLNCCF